MKNSMQLQQPVFQTEISRRLLLSGLVMAIGTQNYWLSLSQIPSNLKEIKTDSFFRFIETFHETMIKQYIPDWESLFISASELAGAKAGTYIDQEGTYRSISDFFTADTHKSNISKLATSLDIACKEAMDEYENAKAIYYELGQLLHSMQYWLISTSDTRNELTLLESFPNLKKFFEKYQPLMSNWRSKNLLTID